ncbi:MAG TPA: hypothetical protein VHM26_08400, partial [Chitinophagaceae bacterium]|nr:hypothetical protein [Chitinophagaceae bacterium]
MRKALLVPLLLVTLFVSAQTPNDNHGNLPQIIPPSPDVASLAKVGNTSTSLHTGAANVNIPLYEIKVGSLTVPLALSYSTNGTRVNDISGRVGLGWNLIAGGNISRVVHDEEDDGTNTIQLAPVSFNPPTSASYTYVYNSDIEHYDTEADEYSFSVNGLSGKFFFDGSGVIRVVEHSNIKIVKQGNSFTLTGPDGTKYEFGKNLEIEKTRDVKTNGNQRAHKIKTTAWFLTRIISATGDQIDFTYNSIYVKNAMGPYQTVLLKAYQQASLPVPPCSQGCETLCEGQWSPVGFNRLDYDTYYLSQITTSNGQAIYLTYQDSPDLSGNNRLTGVNVYTTNDAPLGKLVKQYQLEYQDYTVSTDLNQRFFLTKLHNINTADPLQKLTHLFTYNDPSQLPSIESYGQDYYGFSQGPTTYNTNFFPRPADYNSYENGYMGADRTPNLEGPKAGTLQKVTYPTGGYEEFIYEQHSLPQSTTTYDTTRSTTWIQGAGLNYNSIN